MDLFGTASVTSAITWLMDQVGFAICHQLDDRSLTYGGRVLPVCARDTGMFLGFSVCFVALLLAYGWGRRRYPSWPKIIALALFVLPAVVDATTSYAGLRESTNAIRLVTGALAGAGLAALVFPLSVGVFSPAGEVEDTSIRHTVFRSWWSIPLLLSLPVVISLLLWPDWPGAYWVWAPLVTLSIIFTLLVLNYTLIALALVWSRGEDRLPSATKIAGLASLATLVELVSANRLHWLVERFL
jgi:uncharacterized membrane protein